MLTKIGQSRLPGPLDGFRNKIINGDFDVWQRGTSFGNANFGTGNYCADRWLTRFDASGSDRAFSRQAFTPGQTDVPGEPKYFGRYAVSAVGTGATYRVLEQKIEGVRTLAGKKATLTLYAKAAAALTLPQIRLRQDFGTGGAPSAAVDIVAASNIAVGTGWAKLQYVVDIPPLAAKTIGTSGNDQLALTIFLPVGTTFTFDIAHVSLVEGDATAEADPFSPRHIQQEMAMCERYYERRSFFHTGYGPGGGALEIDVPFRVQKRGTPTMTILEQSYANGSSFQLNSPSIERFIARYYASVAGTATINGAWVADAEL